MNANDNKNEEKLTTAEVDEEAWRLATKYNNTEFIKFYYKVIHRLGKPRAIEIEARVSEAKFPGKLFTKIANEELRAKELRSSPKRIAELDTFRNDFGNG